MTEEQKSQIREVCNDLGDVPCDEKYGGGEYIFCLRVERVINGQIGMGLPWTQIHKLAKEWLCCP